MDRFSTDFPGFQHLQYGVATGSIHLVVTNRVALDDACSKIERKLNARFAKASDNCYSKKRFE